MTKRIIACVLAASVMVACVTPSPVSDAAMLSDIAPGEPQAQPPMEAGLDAALSDAADASDTH